MTIEGITEWVTPWHGLEADPEEAGTAPLCYTDREWRGFWTATKMAAGRKKITYSKVFAAACEDCQVWYQKQQLSQGRCQPENLLLTPLFRESDG